MSGELFDHGFGYHLISRSPIFLSEIFFSEIEQVVDKKPMIPAFRFFFFFLENATVNAC